MAFLFLLTLYLSWLGFASADPEADKHARSLISVLAACSSISSSVSSASSVYWPLSGGYDDDIGHWASSSTEVATCSVEPGTAADVGIILKEIGSSKSPFAVKGGGHTMNVGFSSTTGIQISMARFNEVTYDDSAGTATIGTGLIWDEVYAALEPYDVNVVGGRVTGVGVAGFTLGGGFSWKSNQYGLTIDTVQSYELVLPNGTVTTVDSSSAPDLFFGLRGGLNNFGIVTKFTLKTFPQTQVWGGTITCTDIDVTQVTTATANFFASVTDPKASSIIEYDVVAGLPITTIQLFYDAPNPPSGIFDQFLALPACVQDISTRSFTSLVQSAPSNDTSGLRGAFHTVSLTGYSSALLNVIVNETLFWGDNLSSLLGTGGFISYDVEFFLPSVFSHGSNSAYPADRSRGLLPLNLYFAWLSPTSDTHFQNVLLETAQTITNAAVAEGQDVANAELYPNYAIAGTSMSRLYGSNLAQLKTARQKYDPNGVMLLSGGWKFQ